MIQPNFRQNLFIFCRIDNKNLSWKIKTAKNFQKTLKNPKSVMNEFLRKKRENFSRRNPEDPRLMNGWDQASVKVGVQRYWRAIWKISFIVSQLDDIASNSIKIYLPWKDDWAEKLGKTKYPAILSWFCSGLPLNCSFYNLDSNSFRKNAIPVKSSHHEISKKSKHFSLVS